MLASVLLIGSYIYFQVSVKHWESPSGPYRIPTLQAAQNLCRDKGMTIASEDQLLQAWRMGYDMCSCGWLADGSVQYPKTNDRPGCHEGTPPGLMKCLGDIANKGGWDVYCFRG